MNFLHFNIEGNIRMKLSIYHLLLLFIVMVWGINVVAIKYLVHIFPPLTMTSLRIFVAGTSILLFLYCRQKSILLSIPQFIQIAVISIFGVIGHHAFLAAGIHQTTASNAGIIMGLIPLVTSLCSILFLNVRLSGMKCTGFLIGFLGVIFIVLKNPESVSIQLGDLYIFLCVVSQGISFILLKKAMQTLSAAIVTGWMFTLGSFGLFVIGLLQEPTGITQLYTTNLTAWSVFLTSAIISTAMGHLLYNRTMHKIGSIDSAIFINLAPFFTLVSSSFLLDETIYWTQIVGFICVMAGVLLGIGFTKKKAHTSCTPASVEK